MPLSSKPGTLAIRQPGRMPDKRNKPTKMEFWDRLDYLLDKIYRWAYYAGAQVHRYGRRASKHLETWFYRSKDKAAAKRAKHRGNLARYFKKLLRDTIIPVFDVAGRFRKYKTRVLVAKEKAGSHGVYQELLHILWDLSSLLWHIVAAVLNYVAPVVAVLFLAATINTFTGYTFALSVNYAGENIGYVLNESVFESAEKEVKKRIVYDNALTITKIDGDSAPEGAGLREPTQEEAAFSAESVAPVALAESNMAETLKIEPAKLVSTGENNMVAMPKYTLAVISEDELLDEDILTDIIIQASGSEITQASGLYIEDEFKGASTEPDEVLDLMNKMLNQFETGEENEKIHFVSKIALKDGLYPVSSIKTTDSIDSMINGNTSGESYYSVVSGDDPWSISEKTGVPLKELERMNPEMDENFQPGKQILVSRSVPMMKVQVTRRETYNQDQPFETEYVDDAKLLRGVEQTVTSGVNGVNEVVADVTYIDGTEISRNVVREEPVSEARNRVVKRGTNVPKASGNGAATGGFIWPANGGYISMPIWGYWGHTGTDIAGSSGTPIMASMAGTVVYSGQTYWGYGKHIIIQHDSGVQTLYAHNSALYVSVGQRVEQGQIIAAMGRTGNASGNHVHFEIRQNGSYLDARNYIGSSSPY